MESMGQGERLGVGVEWQSMRWATLYTRSLTEYCTFFALVPHECWVCKHWFWLEFGWFSSYESYKCQVCVVVKALTRNQK